MYNSLLKFSLLALVFFFALSGCKGPTGPDGSPGNAYVKVTDSDGYLYSYSDNNPAVASPVHVDFFYLTDPGVYDFTYHSRIYYPDNSFDENVWTGNYSIHINEGDPGGPGKIFWQRGDAGADGPDSYLALSCDYNGATYSRLNKIIQGVRPKIGAVVHSREAVGGYLFEVTSTLKASGHHASGAR